MRGWYGMASVKWLKRVIVTRKPFDGYWQTIEYAYFKREHGLPTLAPIGANEVKAQIARPTWSEHVAPASTYRVTGAAWAGESEVSKVEVSSDAGRTWQAATLLGASIPFAWRLWEFLWAVPAATDRKSLMVRATDRSGRVQPEHHDKDKRAYLINHVVPIEVDVR